MVFCSCCSLFVFCPLFLLVIHYDYLINNDLFLEQKICSQKLVEARKDGALLPLVNKTTMYIATHHSSGALSSGLDQSHFTACSASILSALLLSWPLILPLWLTLASPGYLQADSISNSSWEGIIFNIAAPVELKFRLVNSCGTLKFHGKSCTCFSSYSYFFIKICWASRSIWYDLHWILYSEIFAL